MSLPTNCLSCNSILAWSKSGVDLLCLNPMCPAQVINKIEHFCRCMGIEEMSAVTLEKLELKSINDLYKLNHANISCREGFGDRKAEIITEQIAKSLLDVMPAKLIEAFGIPGVGEKTAEALLKILKGKTSHEKIEHFFKITKDELHFIDGIGQVTAENIINSQKALQELYNFLQKSGLGFKETNMVSEKLLGKNVAMTGACPDGRRRPELEAVIAMHGGSNGSVNKSTHILVAEDPAGNSSKLKNARKYGIEIVSYEQFFKDL